MGRDGLASSVNLLLPDAEKTGKLTSIANAVVREADGRQKHRPAQWVRLYRSPTRRRR